MSYFWTAQEQIPDGMGFALYHLIHILWLVGILLFCVVITLLFRRWKKQCRQNVLRIAVWSMLLLELTKDAVLVVTGQFRAAYLPLDLCGLSILLELIAVYRPHPLLLELLYSLSLPGACLALLFPNWYNLPIWNFFALHSFVLHSLLVLVPVLLRTSGQLCPNWRHLPFCFTCIAAACIPVAWVNRQCGTNFFFLARPSSGSPLVWFEQVFGNHLIGLPVLMALVWLGMYGIPLLWHRITTRQ